MGLLDMFGGGGTHQTGALAPQNQFTMGGQGMLTSMGSGAAQPTPMGAPLLSAQGNQWNPQTLQASTLPSFNTYIPNMHNNMMQQNGIQQMPLGGSSGDMLGLLGAVSGGMGQEEEGPSFLAPRPTGLQMQAVDYTPQQLAQIDYMAGTGVTNPYGGILSQIMGV